MVHEVNAQHFFRWKSMKIHWQPLMSMKVNGFPSNKMLRFNLMNIHDSLWNTMNIHGFPWPVSSRLWTSKSLGRLRLDYHFFAFFSIWSGGQSSSLWETGTTTFIINSNGSYSLLACLFYLHTFSLRRLSTSSFIVTCEHWLTPPPNLTTSGLNHMIKPPYTTQLLCWPRLLQHPDSYMPS